MYKFMQEPLFTTENNNSLAHEQLGISRMEYDWLEQFANGDALDSFLKTQNPQEELKKSYNNILQKLSEAPNINLGREVITAIDEAYRVYLQQLRET